MNALLPLAHSHSHDQLEEELKNLMILLYQKHLEPRARDVNVTGAPFLGSSNIQTKALIHDGIGNFNSSVLSSESLQYLLLAYKYRNGKRGLGFLKTFLTVTWGSDFEINQLWQKKGGVYPSELKTKAEIEGEGLDANDYFLTSRLQLVLSEEVTEFPADIARNLDSTLPARLFITDIFRSIGFETTIGFGFSAPVSSINFAYGSTEP